MMKNNIKFIINGYDWIFIIKYCVIIVIWIILIGYGNDFYGREIFLFFRMIFICLKVGRVYNWFCLGIEKM